MLYQLERQNRISLSMPTESRQPDRGAFVQQAAQAISNDADVMREVSRQAELQQQLATLRSADALLRSDLAKIDQEREQVAAETSKAIGQEFLLWSRARSARLRSLDQDLVAIHSQLANLPALISDAEDKAKAHENGPLWDFSMKAEAAFLDPRRREAIAHRDKLAEELSRKMQVLNKLIEDLAAATSAADFVGSSCVRAEHVVGMMVREKLKQP